MNTQEHEQLFILFNKTDLHNVERVLEQQEPASENRAELEVTQHVVSEGNRMKLRK
jgi:hypothetical protein